MIRSAIPGIIAHRGYSARAPENTRAAFQQAVDAGVSWVECDIRRARDGTFILMHDAAISRTTNGSGAVRNLGWEELRQCDAGSWFHTDYHAERVLRLEEFLQSIPDSVQINLEVKPSRMTKEVCREYVRSLLDILSKHNRLRRCLVSSFSVQFLRTVREADEQISLGLLTHGTVTLHRARVALASVRAEWCIHNIHTLRAGAVHRLHREGYKVAAFTVNSTKHIARALKCDVDYIITNDIHTVQQVLGNRGATLR